MSRKNANASAAAAVKMNPKLVVIRTNPAGAVIDPNKAPADVSAVAQYLLGKSASLRSKDSIFRGQRVSYFKGKRAVEALLKESYPHKSRPKITSQSEAVQMLQSLMETHNFFFRVRKGEEKTLDIDPQQTFAEDAYYVWQYETPWARMKATLYSFLLIGIVLMGVMFPLWPQELRTGVWYLSMVGVGLIGALIVLAIIRGVMFLLSLAFIRSGIWLFPNLFADVGVVDSFIPLWGWGGVDYEKMHLEKYRRQRKGEKKSGKKKSKKQSGEGGNQSASSADVLDAEDSGKKKQRAKIVELPDDEDEEPVEEIEAESRPLVKK